MSLSLSQLIELLVVLCNSFQFRYLFSRVKSALAHAEAKSGSVRPDTVPTHLSGAFFSILQLSVCSLIPLVYTISVVGTGLQQPAWMSALALPKVVAGIRSEGFWESVVRVLACVGSILSRRIADSAFEHLSDQYHPIGRREKPRVVQTGPYAWVRHPLYALALLQAVLQTFMFWSCAPLFALVAIAVVFGIKLQAEEEIIQRDSAIRDEYRAYMRKVPARLVPYVW